MSKPNEPAFPFAYSFGPDDNYHASGLTKREWFAGMALQGMLAEASHPESCGYGSEDFNNLAEHAYKLADAMLEEGGEG